MPEARRHFICRLDELADPGSTAASLVPGGGDGAILVVRRGQRVYGYHNHCPHTGAPLDWNPGDFLSADQRHIQCAVHAALFQFEDGVCVEGPCAGDRLMAVSLEIESGNVYLLK